LDGDTSKTVGAANVTGVLLAGSGNGNRDGGEEESAEEKEEGFGEHFLVAGGFDSSMLRGQLDESRFLYTRSSKDSGGRVEGRSPRS
jgi:hypothetical protein